VLVSTSAGGDTIVMMMSVGLALYCTPSTAQWL